MQSLRLLAWIVCGIYATVPGYWLMVHPFAERWRRARYRLAVLAPLWVGMWCISWAASYPWRDKPLYRGAEGWAAAPLLWVVSLLMYFHAARGLSWRRVIGQHELEPERHPGLHPTSLVTGGVHGMVRHPMYVGHICTMLGFALGAGTPACFGLLAFAMLTGAVMTGFEERELHRRFGAAWEEYRARTPAIFPTAKAKEKWPR